MSAKAKFVYKKPFDTHETYGIKKPIEFYDVYGEKKEGSESSFYECFKDYSFKCYYHQSDSQYVLHTSYQDLVNTFGKPIKIKKDYRVYKNLFQFDGRVWSMDCIWYLVLTDQRIKGKKVNVPVMIYNEMDGKNYFKNYEKEKKNSCFWNDILDTQLLKNFERNYPKPQSTGNNLSEIKNWFINIGTKWNQDVDIYRSEYQNKEYIENLIMEYK